MSAPSSFSPDPAKVRQVIEQIDTLDLKTADIDAISEILEPLFMSYKITVPKYDPGIYLFRGRILNEKPKTVDEIKYPPRGIAKIGRANDHGESIFYAATARNVSFFELHAKEGQTIALSCWKTTNTALLNHIGFSSATDWVKESSRQATDLYKFASDTRAISELNASIHDYLAQRFCRDVTDPNYYKLTNAIARRLLKSPLDGLMYPTIRMKGNADNVLLKADYAESSLKFISVQFVRVKGQEEFSYTIDTVDSATNYDNCGTLNWLGRDLNWKMPPGATRTFTPSPDGHAGYVVTDEFGNRIDPE
jgi:hypothetical protein